MTLGFPLLLPDSSTRNKLLKFVSLCSFVYLVISASGSTQATNKESIQKMISRLDEDLSTLGQISKLSETLSFPHQVPCGLLSYRLLFYELLKRLMVFFFSSFSSSSVPRRGHKGPDGVGAQGAVREAVSGLQHDLPHHEAGVHHGVRREQLRLRVHLA